VEVIEVKKRTVIVVALLVFATLMVTPSVSAVEKTSCEIWVTVGSALHKVAEIIVPLNTAEQLHGNHGWICKGMK
jgi:hypothetical protein